MNIADFIVKKLKEEGVKKVFGLQGSGTVAQIMDALGRAEGIDYVCTLHEQGAGMAADAYASISEKVGACVVTCGPGATNLYTAIAGSYYNSTPVIYIIGQPALGQLKCSEEIRHFGYQELDVVKVFEAVTKYVTQIMKPKDVRFEIEKAIYMAKEGRPGPVVIAIPDDVTWLGINPEELRPFSIPEKKSNNVMVNHFKTISEKFLNASRPLIMFGKGVRCARAVGIAKEFVEFVNCPVALTWGGKDILNNDDRRNVGSFGVQGTRAGNFAVQNSDFVLAIGVRFDFLETGVPPEHFAEKSYLVSVDVDNAELEKYEHYSIHCDMKICSDAYLFIQSFMNYIKSDSKWDNKGNRVHWSNWINKINEWKNRYSVFQEEYHRDINVNPYSFLETLKKRCSEHNLGRNDQIIITDTSTPRNFVFQAYEVSGSQRVHTWTNFACLGYGLPAAIGAAYAKDSMVIAIMGDGGLQLNIQELSTIVFNNLNIKIFVFDNGGYANIVRLQNRFLDGRHFGSDRENGLPLPDSAKIATAYGLPVYEIRKNTEVEEKIRQVLGTDGPVFCVVYLDINWWTIPFKNGKDPLEDMTPKLPREELEEVMSVSKE